jgi:hypothetical protein
MILSFVAARYAAYSMRLQSSNMDRILPSIGWSHEVSAPSPLMAKERVISSRHLIIRDETGRYIIDDTLPDIVRNAIFWTVLRPRVAVRPRVNVLHDYTEKNITAEELKLKGGSRWHSNKQPAKEQIMVINECQNGKLSKPRDSITF